MLVLSRKKNESIVINNDITIVVVEIRGDKVRLGIEAPKEIPVHRREVFDAIQRGDRSGTSTCKETQFHELWVDIESPPCIAPSGEEIQPSKTSGIVDSSVCERPETLWIVLENSAFLTVFQLTHLDEMRLWD